MEKLISIDEVIGMHLGNLGRNSEKARLGIVQMINCLCGYSSYDGYKVKTSEHEYLILIDNEQNCCENWGYFASEDDYSSFIGKELKSFELTDCALNTKKVAESGYYGDEYGGIQFVNFNFGDGTTLQFAVYNAHNGYYGHEILVLKDSEVLFEDDL